MARVGSIASATAAAGAAGLKAVQAHAGFGSVLASLGSASSDVAANEEATRKGDPRDDDRDDGKRGHARAPADDPAALLAMVGAVAAGPQAASCVDGTAKTAAAAQSVALMNAPPIAAPPGQPLPATAAVTQSVPDSFAAQPATVAAQALPVACNAPAKPVRATPKTAIGAIATSTTDALAARVGKATAAGTGDSDDHLADQDDGAGTTSSPDPAIVTVPALSAAPVPSAAAAASDGQALAATSADRQLDLSRGDAWLDGLARDIASTADAGGTLRFQLSPQRLGDLDVAVTRGDTGTTVAMTTASAAAQAILADARPRLIEQARAHGLHISDARVDLGGTGTGTSDGHRDADLSPGQQRAASSNAGGDADARPRSRAQDEPDLYHGARSQEASASGAVIRARRDLDAGYA